MSERRHRVPAVAGCCDRKNEQPASGVRFVLQGIIGRPEVQEGGPEARARLVIADDHEGTRVLLRTLLGLHPEIEVVGEPENGEEAARLAVSGEADIALLDIEMPRMDGLTAAELIRSVRPQARVILHTASADESKRARARELGLTLLVKGDFDATIAAPPSFLLFISSPSTTCLDRRVPQKSE